MTCQEVNDEDSESQVVLLQLPSASLITGVLFPCQADQQRVFLEEIQIFKCKVCSVHSLVFGSAVHGVLCL